MSNKLKMDKIEAIRNLAAQGWSQRRIARELDAHRSAVKRALQSVQADDGDSKRATVMTGNPAPSQSMCDPFREAIEAKLELGLDAKRIHRHSARPVLSPTDRNFSHGPLLLANFITLNS